MRNSSYSSMVFCAGLLLWLCVCCVAQDWSYSNVYQWGSLYGQCNGQRQSPIALYTKQATYRPQMRLIFLNYNLPFAAALAIDNNGHTVSVEVNTTVNGLRPLIVTDEGTFQVESLHFHWGSANTLGSEHAINGNKFAAEMHIVHKNIKYPTIEEAQRWTDGLTVLSILLTADNLRTRRSSTLSELLLAVPLLRNPDSRLTMQLESLTLKNLLGQLNRRRYFKYAGSLTTPPCSQAAIFIVFMEPLTIQKNQLANFWNLVDSNFSRMVNNFRPLQARNRRAVYYRV